MSVIAKLMEGEELSEEFKEKAGLIVQKAIDEQVNEKVEAKVAELEEANTAKVEEAAEEVKSKIAEDVSDFLTYAVNEWFAKNQIGIESGLKVQIAESFLTGIRGLAEEHNVELPEGKESIVENLESKVSDLQSKLDESIQKSVSLSNEVEDMKRKQVLESASADLTDTQREKLMGLVEDVEFDSTEKFESKVSTLIESFFSAPSQSEEGKEDNGVDLNEDAPKEQAPKSRSYLDQLTEAATS